jgi:CBS domain-containing protein
VSGKELQLDDTAGAARLLLARHAVKTIPVLDGRRYVGAVDRELLATVGDDVPMHELATSSLLPTSAAATPAWDALAALDAHGGTRLVVLAADGETYVGIVCLRGDRDRLCVDARLALDAGR